MFPVLCLCKKCLCSCKRHRTQGMTCGRSAVEKNRNVADPHAALTRCLPKLYLYQLFPFGKDGVKGHAIAVLHVDCSIIPADFGGKQ